jgi:hypothetical protein
LPPQQRLEQPARQGPVIGRVIDKGLASDSDQKVEASQALSHVASRTKSTIR